MSGPTRIYSDEERRLRHNEVCKNYRVLNRDAALRSGWTRNSRMRGYGVSVEEYDNFLSATHCRLCGIEFVREPKSNPKAPVLDHDHETKTPRDAICRKCNLGLGHFNDSVELLERAVLYLKEFK